MHARELDEARPRPEPLVGARVCSRSRGRDCGRDHTHYAEDIRCGSPLKGPLARLTRWLRRARPSRAGRLRPWTGQAPRRRTDGQNQDNKVAVVDSRAHQARRVVGGRGHRVPRPDRGRDGGAAQVDPHRRRRLQGLQEHPRAPRRLGQRPRAADRAARGPNRDRLRLRRRERGRQGPPDFAKAAPALIIKGGVLDGSLLGAKELGALADLPSRDVLLVDVRRRARRADAHDGRPLEGATAELRLRPERAHRVQGRRAGGGAARAEAPAPPKDEAAAADRGRATPAPVAAAAEAAEPRGHRASRPPPTRRGSHREADPTPDDTPPRPPKRPRRGRGRRRGASSRGSSDRRGSRGARLPPSTDGAYDHTRSSMKGRPPTWLEDTDKRPDPRRHLRAVRPGAERAAEGVRGALRRDRGSAGRRRRPRSRRRRRRRRRGGGEERVRRDPHRRRGTRRSR